MGHPHTNEKALPHVYLNERKSTSWQLRPPKCSNFSKNTWWQKILEPMLYSISKWHMYCTANLFKIYLTFSFVLGNTFWSMLKIWIIRRLKVNCKLRISSFFKYFGDPFCSKNVKAVFEAAKICWESSNRTGISTAHHGMIENIYYTCPKPQVTVSRCKDGKQIQSTL